jgi:amino acid transporter
MIIIARVLYGLADRGQLPSVLANVDGTTRAPVMATLAGVCAILVLSLAVPLSGLADIASTGTLLVFVVINIALIAIKRREAVPPPDIFLCPAWVPYAGSLASMALLGADLWGRT